MSEREFKLVRRELADVFEDDSHTFDLMNNGMRRGFIIDKRFSVILKNGHKLCSDLNEILTLDEYGCIYNAISSTHHTLVTSRFVNEDHFISYVLKMFNSKVVNHNINSLVMKKIQSNYGIQDGTNVINLCRVSLYVKIITPILTHYCCINHIEDPKTLTYHLFSKIFEATGAIDTLNYLSTTILSGLPEQMLSPEQVVENILGDILCNVLFKLDLGLDVLSYIKRIIKSATKVVV